MSYEGFEQHLCEKGHRFDVNAHFEWAPKCECGPASAFANPVDDTNCDSCGVIPAFEWVKLQLTHVTYKECETCHHKEVLDMETFRIPSQAEAKRMHIVGIPGGSGSLFG